jgi:activator of HSP90 ATPase
MTGGSADIDPRVGGAHSAWDGYITGITLELEPDHRIVQSWRTSEFPADSPDSRLEITLETVSDGTRLTLRHSEIPTGQGASYESGWVENYFQPMAAYFSEA